MQPPAVASPGSTGVDAQGPLQREADLRTSIRPTVAEVDLGALRANVARLRRELGPGVALFGVVKADAYGHGAVRVAQVLAPVCDALAVSLVEEGLELRAAGVTTPVVVLGAYYGRRHSEVIEAGLTPVVYDQADLERFAQAPARRLHSAAPRPVALGPRPLAVHLKVDTGMSRLGVPVAEVGALIERARALPGVRLHGLCTHIACAESPDPAPTRAQLDLFGQVLRAARAQGFAPEVVHVGNSATTVRFPEARHDAVRPGLLLYGTPPSPAAALDGLRPAMSLHTRIMALREIAPGTGVSYGAQFVARRPSRIATLPLGYADGYPRHVRGAEVLVRGQRAPVVGAVCMDLMMIDVTDIPGVTLGDRVTLFGADGDARLPVEELAGWAGTLHYEILCGISKRVPRIYRDGSHGASEPGDGSPDLEGRR
ncbi:MAG: alanine racemase [Armatimonadota bacterium]|nr:alanine racemase [Armatimonadota bacterium]